MLAKLTDSDLTLDTGTTVIRPLKSIRDLEVRFDSELTMKTHISKVVSCCHHQLHRIRQVRRIVVQDVAQQLVSACILSRLDYETVDLLLPFLTTLVNTSLMQGWLPASQNHAIVTPRLKRSGLDPNDMANFRPVSNLIFMSKVIERAAASQLNTNLSANGLMPRHQSAYRKKHSTERAMLRVCV